MNIKVRDAIPEDATAIQNIIAYGYEHSFAQLHTPEYLNKKIKEYQSPERIEKMANTIRDKNSINIVAENDKGEIVGSIGGMQDENKKWHLIALYVAKHAIGNTKFALNLVKEFAKRVKADGATKFTTGTLSNSRVCKLYELLGGKKTKEFINPKRDNVSETEFEFDISRFI